jgi:hypothetical protein
MTENGEAADARRAVRDKRSVRSGGGDVNLVELVVVVVVVVVVWDVCRRPVSRGWDKGPGLMVESSPRERSACVPIRFHSSLVPLPRQRSKTHTHKNKKVGRKQNKQAVQRFAVVVVVVKTQCVWQVQPTRAFPPLPRLPRCQTISVTLDFQMHIERL